MRPGRSSITMADSVQPAFGVPWVDLEMERSVLQQMDDEALQAFWGRWNELERLRDMDPTEHGWKLPSWDKVLSYWKHYVVHVILGGNRSSKSSLLARLMVHLALTIPEAKLRCWHVNDKRSVEDQQRFIYEALPQQYKDMGDKRSRKFALTYSQKNGFVGNECVFPPMPGHRFGSAIYFQNYAQFQQNDKVAEGFWAHAVWGDEEMPQPLFKTLLLRLVDANGRIFLTFTTVNGWTALIQDLLRRTEILERRFAPLVDRELPVLRLSRSRNSAIIHNFWTADNPFIPADGWEKTLAGQPEADILARAYGEPTKSATTVFPKFSENVNVVPHDQLPWLREGGQKENYKCTRYMVADGAGARNWFLIWVAVDPDGTWWIYREWPDEKIGEWAIPGTETGGVLGPAQESFGDGTQAYVDRIKFLEGSEVIFERYLDPRFGATEKQLQDGVITPQQELSDLGMEFILAPGVLEDAGLQELNGKMEYQTKEKPSSTNAPHFYISDRCKNTIFCLTEYTAAQGPKEATKDPIDCLRYLATAKIEYIDTTRRSQSRASGY